MALNRVQPLLSLTRLLSLLCHYDRKKKERRKKERKVLLYVSKHALESGLAFLILRTVLFGLQKYIT